MKSFTFFEILILIAVIAILSGIILPAVIQARSRAYVGKAKAAICAMEAARNLSSYGPDAANDSRAGDDITNW